MPINVILGTNDLEIQDGNGDLIDTIAYQSIDSIAYVYNPGTIVNSSTLGAAPVITGDPQWSAVIWLRDGRKAVIQLGDVDNQSGWTNDQTGFDALAADIYAAFPAGGGGGSGTVTNVSGGTTGLTFSNPTTTPTMSGTLDLDNGGTGATTALGARTNLHAADFYPTLTFRTNTNTNADPGSGSFRLNSATIGSVTEMCVSELAHFETGDYFIIDWQLQWGGTLFLKAVASDDIMTISLGAITNTSFSKFPVTVTTVVSGVANDLPTDNTVWRIVSVGYGGISAGVQNALAGKAEVAIVSGGELVRQNNAVIVPFPSLINEGGAGDGGRCVRYLTDDGTSTGAPLFSSIIGWPTAIIRSSGSSGDPTPMYIVILEQVSGANRVDFFATSPDGTVAPSDTPLMIWVTGIPA